MKLAHYEYPPEIQEIAELVAEELHRARLRYGPMASAHEGWAVLFEEVNELWDEVKLRDPSPLRLGREATQVAAMAMRFILDVVRKPDA